MPCPVCDAELGYLACGRCGWSEEPLHDDFQPSGVEVVRGEDGVWSGVVSWRRSRRAWGILLALGALMMLVLANAGSGLVVRTTVPGVVFLSFVGIGLLYLVLASWVNATTLRLDAEELVVSNGPLPWGGGLRLPADSIEELDVTARLHRGRVLEYRIHARLSNGERRTLAHWIATVDDARYLVEHLESALGFE